MDAETIVMPDGSQKTLIHFVNLEGIIPCMPGLRVFSATGGVNQQRLSPHMRSGEVRAVTCPMCQKTVDFIGAETNLQNALAGRRR